MDGINENTCPSASSWRTGTVNELMNHYTSFLKDKVKDEVEFDRASSRRRRGTCFMSCHLIGVRVIEHRKIIKKGVWPTKIGWPANQP